MTQFEEMLAVLKSIEARLQRIERALVPRMWVNKAGDPGEIVPVNVGYGAAGSYGSSAAAADPLAFRNIAAARGMSIPDDPGLAPELRSDSMGAPRSWPRWR